MAMQEPENSSNTADRQRAEALRRRLAEDPRSLAFVSLAEELNRLGEFEEAATVAQRGLLTHPDSVAGRLALAVAEAERGQVKEALEQIKRALIIDQENPKALALMGQILLRRGLAKRAVQFLSHAVKLAPTDASYGQLLHEARQLAATGDPGAAREPSPSPPAAVFTANAVPVAGDPWSEDLPDRDVEHTVFDPDAVSLVTRGDRGLRAEENGPGGEEPTAFQHPLPKPGGARSAKVGGSAAEYSQMLQRGELPDEIVESEVEPTESGAQVPLKAPTSAEEARSPMVPPAPMPAGSAPQSAVAKPKPPAKGSAVAKPPAPPGSKAARAASKRALSAKGASQPPSPDPAVSVAKPAPSAGAVDKRVGPAATRMVDDALWDLFGNRGPAQAESAPPEAEAPAVEKKSPGRARPAVAGEAAAPHVQPRVVRTSERFGTWAQVATMTVLSVSGALIGHWMMLSSAGPGPEVASEEVKGIATDLERGGLASLLAAEEKATELTRAAPDLKPLMNGVMAEIYGRRWESFGRDPEMKVKGEAALEALRGVRPTVEHVAGMVALSTSAVQREPAMTALRALEEEYPDSPKIKVLMARLHQENNQERAALNKLFEARALHKHHRLTMLELARWYRRSGADVAALTTYAQLMERYPLDVEAAIDRYVLGQATGADPDEAQSVSMLAGLVRNEDPAVAKDETGRASLAFAVPLLARGQLVEGIEELAKAESAFDQSAVFKHAVAGAYFAVGELDRAEALYRAAAKIAPKSRAPKVGLARVWFAREAGLKVDLTREAERVARRFEERPDAKPGVARLPFGTLRLVPGRFEVVEFKPLGSVFPEDEYRKAKNAPMLAALNLTALGNRSLAAGNVEEAIRQFEKALGEKPIAAARFGLGRAMLARGDNDNAIRMLRAAIEQDPDDIPGRLTMARALIARGQNSEALDMLEPLDRSTVVVPDGLLLLGRLRTMRGDYERAVAPLRTVTELQPRQIDAHLAYGEVLHQLRRYNEAEVAFGAAALPDVMARKDLSPIALMYLGQVEVERSSRAGVALLRRALKHEDVPVEAHFFLGRALVKSRRTRREGRRELQRYVRVAPPGELRDTASRLLRRR